MHNCKSVMSSFVDLALDEIPPASSRQLLAELNTCAVCREEFAAMRSTLHVSSRALRSASPAENFWPGYHERLRHSLLFSSRAQLHDQSLASVKSAEIPNRVGLRFALGSLLTSSFRVPVPVAAALLVLFVVAAIFLRSPGPVNAISTNPVAVVETKTVPVPVVQEKVITRVVYVDRKTNRPAREQSGREQLQRTAPSNLASRVAHNPATGSAKTALNLAGFEPTDQVRLTVIKGTYRDEK